MTAESNSYYSALIPVTPNTYYTYSGRANAGNKRLHAYDSSGNWIQQINYASVSSTKQVAFSVSGQTPVNCSYIRISGSQLDTLIQVEQGSTATNYMPYGQIYTDGTIETVTDSNGLTASAERLLAVGNYKDTQSVLDGKVTRNVGIKVLDGTENWSQLSGSSALFTLVVNDFISLGLGDKIIVYSTHFQGVPASATWSNYENLISFTASSGTTENKTFRVRYLSNTKTLAEFKQFLAEQYANGTPVIVVYSLATPTTEQVTPQPLAGNSVTQTAGSIDNLPIESSTIAELKKRYIGDNEVKKVYIGDNLVWENN